MENYKAAAEKLVADLKNSSNIVAAGPTINGTYFGAYRNAQGIVFMDNLGSSPIPKSEAVERLNSFLLYYEKLCATSETWCEFMIGKTFKAELIVLSGQMDFTVATLENGEITWHVNLD